MTFFDEIKLYIPLTEPFNKNGLIEESKQYGFLIKTAEAKSWAVNKIKELRKQIEEFNTTIPNYQHKHCICWQVDVWNSIIDFLMREFEITEEDLK